MLIRFPLLKGKADKDLAENLVVCCLVNKVFIQRNTLDCRCIIKPFTPKFKK